MLLSACLPAGDSSGSPAGAVGVPWGGRLCLLGMAWVGGCCPGPPHPEQPLHAPQARLTSFPGACDKLGRAPAKRKEAHGSGPLNPQAAAPPPHPHLSNSVCLSQARTRCHLAQLPSSRALSRRGEKGALPGGGPSEEQTPQASWCKALAPPHDRRSHSG